MRDGMIVLQTFSGELDAQVAESLLTARGLTAVIDADNCGGMRPHFDASLGVRLLVAEDDVAQAREILDTSEAETIEDNWTCPGCNETLEGGFDTCWSCGATRI